MNQYPPSIDINHEANKVLERFYGSKKHEGVGEAAHHHDGVEYVEDIQERSTTSGEEWATSHFGKSQPKMEVVSSTLGDRVPTYSGDIPPMPKIPQVSESKPVLTRNYHSSINMPSLAGEGTVSPEAEIRDASNDFIKIKKKAAKVETEYYNATVH
eukprot:CAMPEP_0197541108 /NCGR_PEP_ID=MMETSP1318-20131121/66976_1 /TAXON_ID=552666 /ORGANISM="Partenskyella glossopodia, Strain RCC365" /LENGTH=155 /DNA_ID=CAMNT_0043100245 /DNA_START=220 /DNA_END=687 /DNA_ORIENTATION=-